MNYGADSPEDGNFGALPAGTVVTAQVVVTDLGGALVKDATLHAAVTAGGGSVSPAAITTTATGTANFMFTVGSGSTVLEISGKCIGLHPGAGGSGPFSPDPDGPEDTPPVACETGTLTFTAEAVTLVGNAFITDGSVIRLTPSVDNQKGAAWLNERKSVAAGFTASFSFRISALGGIENGTAPDSGNNGADGIAFVIQDQQADALGAAGGGIGYDGVPRSLAVEFDTWLNTEGTVDDPDGNHVAVHTKGTLANSSDEAARIGLPLSPAGVNLSDGGVHSVVIVYTPGTLTVTLDGSLVLTVPVTLTSIGGSSILDGTGRAWVGFTAATGAARENHDVFGVKITTP
jgi:hypothetical protein